MEVSLLISCIGRKLNRAFLHVGFRPSQVDEVVEEILKYDKVLAIVKWWNELLIEVESVNLDNVITFSNELENMEYVRRVFICSIKEVRYEKESWGEEVIKDLLGLKWYE